MEKPTYAKFPFALSMAAFLFTALVASIVLRCDASIHPHGRSYLDLPIVVGSIVLVTGVQLVRDIRRGKKLLEMLPIYLAVIAAWIFAAMMFNRSLH